jgi:hypothetical protein
MQSLLHSSRIGCVIGVHIILGRGGNGGLFIRSGIARPGQSSHAEYQQDQQNECLAHRFLSCVENRRLDPANLILQVTAHVGKNINLLVTLRLVGTKGSFTAATVFVFVIDVRIRTVGRTKSKPYR